MRTNMVRQPYEREDGSIDNEKLTRHMMTRSDLWSGETFCVKKRALPGEKAGVMGYAAFGVVASTALPLTVYLRDSFTRTMQYDSVDAMIADKWEVD
jgi:hypothetical protein